MPPNTWTSFFPRTAAKWVVAHRGASSHHRESSPEAFESAIAAGVAAIETDVRRTSDGVFVCHHDETLRRTAGIDREVAGLTFPELQQLAPHYAVRLTDVLERLRGRCNVLLDLKLHGGDDISALAELLESLGTDETVAIGVRSLATQASLRERNPNLVQLGLLEDPDDVPQFVAAGGRWVRLWEADVSEARVASIHELGVPVLVMVGGTRMGREIGDIDAKGVASLYRQGADGVMLNDPVVAIAVGRAANPTSSARAGR